MYDGHWGEVPNILFPEQARSLFPIGYRQTKKDKAEPQRTCGGTGGKEV
jgi:hypothetical protein